MKLWALVVLVLLLLASCIALWIKLRWRVAKLYDLEELGAFPEVGTIFLWGAYLDRFNGLPPFNALPFTPTITCEPPVSELLKRYDWLVTPVSPFIFRSGCERIEPMPWVEITFEGDPQTVWAAPMAVDRLLDLAERHCDPSHNNRVVHFAGTEDPLTHAFGGTWALRNATVRRLQKYFRRIVYQTMDASIEGVQLAPMGLSWGYMVALSDALVRARRSPAYSAREFMGLVQNASRVDLSWKTKGVLATKSKVASWLDSSSVGKAVLEARRRGPANVIYFPATNSSASSVLDAWTSRAGMRRFVTTPMAKRAGVEWRGLAHPEWWAEMPKYRFLLSPMGSAIQTSKTYEALLALTVPITEHMGYAAFFDLVKMGFPLVVVDVWTQVTPENTTRWWKELSPRLEGFRKNCLTVDGYWKMITGQVRYCQ